MRCELSYVIIIVSKDHGNRKLIEFETGDPNWYIFIPA